MCKIILQNTSTEEKQEYENTWGKKQTPIHQKSSLSRIIRGKREEKQTNNFKSDITNFKRKSKATTRVCSDQLFYSLSKKVLKGDHTYLSKYTDLSCCHGDAHISGNVKWVIYTSRCGYFPKKHQSSSPTIYVFFSLHFLLLFVVIKETIIMRRAVIFILGSGHHSSYVTRGLGGGGGGGITPIKVLYL